MENSFKNLKQNVVQLFSYFGSILVLTAGIINLLKKNYITGFIETIGVILGLSTIFFFIRFKKNIETAANIFLSLTLVVFTTIFYTGGFDGTGILWMFYYPIICFFYKGHQKGKYFAATYLASLFIAYILSNSLLHKTTYNFITCIILFLSLITESVFMYFYEYIKNKAETDLIAGLIEIKALNLKLEELSTIDTLTGIYNRRKIIDTLKTELIRATRYKTPFAVILFDIDLFKSVNDTFGHLFGDFVLKEVTSVIKHKILRQTDSIGRYGGEEFLVILPETDDIGGYKAAERMRNAIKENGYYNEEVNKYIEITASFGVAQVINPVKLDELLRQADIALYAAKNQGRDKSIIFSKALCAPEDKKYGKKNEENN
jgi:diguanylate cyclase (GGDEF)-like protein